MTNNCTNIKRKETDRAIMFMESFWFPLLLCLVCLGEWFRTKHYSFAVIGTMVWFVLAIGLIEIYKMGRS